MLRYDIVFSGGWIYRPRPREWGMSDGDGVGAVGLRAIWQFMAFHPTAFKSLNLNETSCITSKH